MQAHSQKIQEALKRGQQVSVREVGKDQTMVAIKYAVPDLGQGPLEKDLNQIICKWSDPKGWEWKDGFDISTLEIV
jgi:hypothetical protein